MSEPTILKIHHSVVTKLDLGIAGLQKHIEAQMIEQGKPLNEVLHLLQQTHKDLPEIGDINIQPLSEHLADMNDSCPTYYYMAFNELEQKSMNTLPTKSVTQNYIFVIGDRHPILRMVERLGTDALRNHLKTLVENHNLKTVYNLMKLNYGNSVSQLRSVAKPDQLIFEVYREQDFEQYTYENQPRVFKIAAELKSEIHAIAESAVKVLRQAQDQCEGETQVVEKTFEQAMADVPEIPYNQLAFIDHMQDRVKEDVPDMDDYHKVLNTLWRIFCTGGWDRDDESYLECVDHFRGRFEPNCDMTQVKIGSQVQLMSGEIHTVENFMWLNPLDLFSEEYKLAIKFVDKNEAKTYTETGWHDTNHKYNMDNIVSVDGKAEN